MVRSFRSPTGVATALLATLWVVSPAGRVALAEVGPEPAWPGQEPAIEASASRHSPELLPTTLEREIDRRFNEIRTDVLANQASAVQWWMRLMAIMLTFFGIAVPVLGFLGFNRFREIERDTRHNAEAAAKAVVSTRRYLEDLEFVHTDLVRKSGQQKMLGRQEADLRTCLDRGAAKADMGRHEEAIAEYDAAIRLGGGVDGDAYHNRGASCLALERYQEAIADYDAAIRLDSLNADAYAMRGFAKAEVGQTEGAIADYDESIRLQPNDVFAYLNRGRAWWEAGKHEEAIADFDRAIALEPNDGGTWLARGVVKRRAGRRGEARRDLESALSLAREIGDEVLAEKVSGLLQRWRA